MALAALATILVASPVAAADTDFHAPRSEPERALDRILKRADSDTDLLDNLLRGRGTKNFKPKVDYRPLLTAGLIEAIRAEEARSVRNACKGKYLKGEICGIDYSPITCAQDNADHYEYRTLDQQQDRARVEYRWPGDKMAATYTLLKEAGWRIDAVKCASGIAFKYALKVR